MFNNFRLNLRLEINGLVTLTTKQEQEMMAQPLLAAAEVAEETLVLLKAEVVVQDE